jgi:hypothetical protein
MPFVLAHRRRRLRRVRPSPRQHSANHPPVPMVNRDASRSFAGRDNGGPAPHARAGRDGLTGNAGRRHVVRRVEPDGRNHRRSRCGHDRNGCRSPPGRTRQPLPERSSTSQQAAGLQSPTRRTNRCGMPGSLAKSPFVVAGLAVHLRNLGLECQGLRDQDTSLTTQSSTILRMSVEWRRRQCKSTRSIQ